LEVLNDDRITIDLVKNETEVKKKLSDSISSGHLIKMEFNVYANYSNVFTEQVAYTLRAIEKTLRFIMINRNTIKCYSYDFVKTFINNIPAIIDSVHMKNIMNLYKGKTAVIISSGPSLSKNVMNLKEYRDKALIISGVRNLKFLLEVGIIPDIVCAIDPTEKMYSVVSDSLDNGIPFGVVDTVNYKIVAEHTGKNLFVINQFNDIYEYIFGEQTDYLGIGGSVAHLCTILGIYMGCKNIIFIGQDLAYPDNKVHADVVTNAKVEENSSYFADMYVKGNYQDKILTDSSMKSFKEWFESLIINTPQVKFINCTEGGAKIEGTSVEKLSDTLKEKCSEKLDKSLITKAMETQNHFDRNKIVSNMEYIIKDLSDMHEKCKDGIKNAKKMQEYYEGFSKVNINKILEKLDKIDTFIENESKISGIISSLMYESLEEVLYDDEYREKKNETDREKGIRLAKRSLKIYENYVKAIKTFRELLEESVEKLKKSKD
jgi:hypothetical protein